MSPPPITVLITQTALHSQDSFNDHLKAPATFPKFSDKKAKATTKVILYEPPNIQVLQRKFTLTCTWWFADT